MATNTYNNVAAITRAAMNVLRNNLQLPKLVNRTYDEEFDAHGAKIGDTVNVRIPGIGTRRMGKVASPNAYYDSYVPVTVSQKGADLKFSSKDLALNVEEGSEFERSVLGPQMAALVNGEEADGLALYKSIYCAQGTPGTAPTDLSTFLNAKAVLADGATPFDDNISCLLNPWTSSSMVNGLKGLFQDASEISKQYVKGKMGSSGGMTFYECQNLAMHTVGALPGSPVTNGAVSTEGATTISINGITSGQGALKKGDVITIAGCNRVNPVSKVDTGQLMQFVVTADTADSSGAMATLPISPAIYSSASGAKQNVTGLPAGSKAVTVFGAANTYAGKVSPANLIFHKDAFAYVCRDLPKVPGSYRVRDRDLGISIRVTEWFDGGNDDMLYRLDILTGWGLLRPEFAVRQQG